MKYLKDLIKENISINEAQVKTPKACLTYELKKLFRAKDDFDFDEVMDDLKLDGLIRTNTDEKFYTDLINLAKRTDSHIYTNNTGKLYGDGTMYDILLSKGAIEAGDRGFIITRDGDDGMCTICTYGKRCNKRDLDLFSDYVSALSSNNMMSVAREF